MLFRNSNGYEYEIRLDSMGQIRIDHANRKNMTVDEYTDFAGVPRERGYFERMGGEIRDALISGEGFIEISPEDLES